MPHFPKPYADRVAKLRVPGLFVLIATFAWLARPSAASLAWGVPVSVIGLAIRAWAAGHLAKNQQLAQSGPYAFTRNPLYIGTLLMALGMVIAARSVCLALVFAAVFLLIYLPVIELEEQHLRHLFPEYATYSQQVPALWPRFSGSGNGRFEGRLYWKNQEYRALLGFLAGLGWLIWRAL
ncbi:MAG TPA: protein-S-isoprenylcysteine methyltransferase [Solibacterales bacterium]|nr:protein-S-isoprenylcysteine methyltransferase [Bryobacterales bacterium]